MLTLPIKKKWFDMILSGEKKEEYREIKRYWTTRIHNWCINDPEAEDDIQVRFSTTRGKSIYPLNIIIRNGYVKNAPQIKCKCRLFVGEGKEEWGAEEGKIYYIFSIEEIYEEKE